MGLSSWLSCHSMSCMLFHFLLRPFNPFFRFLPYLEADTPKRNPGTILLDPLIGFRISRTLRVKNPWIKL